MQKIPIKAFLSLFAVICFICPWKIASAADPVGASYSTHTLSKNGLLAKLSDTSKISNSPALLDYSANSELRPLALAGLNKFDIVIEELDQDAAKCGFSGDKLEQAVRDALAQANIALVYKYSPEANATIYLSVNALSDCTTNYTLGVFTSTTIRETGNFSFARIWWTEGLRSGGGTPAADLEEQIVEGARQLGSDWKLANGD